VDFFSAIKLFSNKERD